MLSPLAWCCLQGSTAQRAGFTAELFRKSIQLRSKESSWLFMKMWALTWFRDVSWVSWHSQLSEWTLKTVRCFASGLKASFLPLLIVSTAMHDCSYSLSLPPLSWVLPLLKWCIAFFKVASQNWCDTASLVLPAAHCMAKQQGEPDLSLYRAVKIGLGWNTPWMYLVRGTVFWKHQRGMYVYEGANAYSLSITRQKKQGSFTLLVKAKVWTWIRMCTYVAFLTSQLVYNPLESK